MISVSSHDRNENLPDSPDELDNVSVSPFYERVRGELCVGGTTCVRLCWSADA